MAAPSYTTDLTNIYAGAGSTTNWTALGGGASGLNAETDYYIQGTGMTSKNAWAGDLKGMIYNPGTTTVAAGDAIFIWITHLTPNSLATEASGGVQVLVGSGTAAYYQYYVAGSDTWIYDERWLCAVVDPRTGTVTPDNTTGSPGGTITHIGGQANLPSGGPTKGSPFGIDAIRHGRTLTVTNGDLANGYGTFVGAAAQNDDNTTNNNRWGLFQFSKGTYQQKGLFELGTTATSVDFRDANRVIFVERTPKVHSAFNGFEINNASSRVDWTNISISSLGTTSKGYLSVNDNADVNIDGCTFVDMDTFDFLSNTTVSGGTVFRRCGQITSGGANLATSTVTGYTGTADTSAVIWNQATNPNGNLDDMNFVKGTTATHAIQFGASSSTTINLSNVTFSGYNASDGQNDSELYFADTGSDVTWTVNLSGMTNPSYKKARAGDTVTFVNTITVTLSGLPTNVEVRVYNDTGSGVAGTEINGIENTTGSTFAFSASAGTNVIITIFDEDYAPIRNLYTVPSSNTTLPIQLINDGWYLNP